MARDTVVRVRLTDERHADLEEAAKSYGVASATMATVIIGEWLDKRKQSSGDRTLMSKEEILHSMINKMPSTMDCSHGSVTRSLLGVVSEILFTHQINRAPEWSGKQ